MSACPRTARFALGVSLVLGLVWMAKSRADEPWPDPEGKKTIYTQKICVEEDCKQPCWFQAPCQQNKVAACQDWAYVKSTQSRNAGKCQSNGGLTMQDCWSWDTVYCARLGFHQNSLCEQERCSSWIVIGGGYCDPAQPMGPGTGTGGEN
jgi:hypothetical protein